VKQARIEMVWACGVGTKLISGERVQLRSPPEIDWGMVSQDSTLKVVVPESSDFGVEAVWEWVAVLVLSPELTR
jgi:hypothetical protein